MRTIPQSKWGITKKLLIAGAVGCVLFFLLNWLFGNWFFKGAISKWGSLWSPGRLIWIPEGILLSLIALLASGFFLALSSVMEDLIVRQHKGSGTVINPPSMIPGFLGLGLFVGGLVLVFRYLYLIALLGWLALRGVPVHFNMSIENLQPLQFSESGVARSQLTEANLWILGPQDRDKAVGALMSTTWVFLKDFTSGDNIPAGALIYSDLGGRWSQFPVKPLVYSYDGGHGLFVSQRSFQLPAEINNNGHLIDFRGEYIMIYGK